MRLAEQPVDETCSALDDFTAAGARKMRVPDDRAFFLERCFDAAGVEYRKFLFQAVHGIKNEGGKSEGWKLRLLSQPLTLPASHLPSFPTSAPLH